MDFLIQYHSVRRCNFLNFVFSKIDFPAFRKTVRTRCNGIHNLALFVSGSPVGRDNVLRRTDFIDSAGKSLHLVNRLVNGRKLVSVFICAADGSNAEEHLAGFLNRNRAFLSHIFLIHFDNCNPAFLRRMFLCHIKINRRAVKNIAIRSLYLHNGVACTVW